MHFASTLRTFLLVCAIALPTSVCRSADLPVPGKGHFRIALSPPWKVLKRDAPANQPPTIHLERASHPRGELEITVLWDPKGISTTLSEDKLRDWTMKGNVAIVESSVEIDFPLTKFKGSDGTGFHFSATDKTYTRPASGPVPGDYPVITHGVMGLGSLVISFTIFSDQKNDLSVQESLAALKLSRLVPIVKKQTP
ncbi:MAG: hypothetical protein Q8O00_09410 [Holophaga sp.]|nr:hypothetical protein [Holophaga sp.]